MLLSRDRQGSVCIRIITHPPAPKICLCECKTAMSLPTPPRRVDVKVNLANERTFLTWMRQVVLVGGIGAAVSGIAAYQGIHPSLRPHPGDGLWRLLALKVVGLALMLLAAALSVAVARNFLRRGVMIRQGVGSDSPEWDSRWLPRLLTATMTGVMTAVWVMSLIRVAGRG